MAITLDPEQIAEIAARHEDARTSRRLIKRITLDHPDMTLDDAYACQKAWTDLQVANGAIVRGHKIGLTSRAMQQAMKIDEPDFGVLFDYMFFESGATLTADRLPRPQDRGRAGLRARSTARRAGRHGRRRPRRDRSHRAGTRADRRPLAPRRSRRPHRAWRARHDRRQRRRRRRHRR